MISRPERRNYWLDDELGETLTILKFLAPHVAEDGYGGYYREVYDQTPVTFMFRDGTYAVRRYPLPPNSA